MSYREIEDFCPFFLMNSKQVKARGEREQGAGVRGEKSENSAF